MERLEYTSPDIEIICFETTDVIPTSGENDTSPKPLD